MTDGHLFYPLTYLHTESITDVAYERHYIASVKTAHQPRYRKTSTDSVH
jgi:hypothetical protein